MWGAVDPPPANNLSKIIAILQKEENEQSMQGNRNYLLISSEFTNSVENKDASNICRYLLKQSFVKMHKFA